MLNCDSSVYIPHNVANFTVEFKVHKRGAQNPSVQNFSASNRVKTVSDEYSRHKVAILLDNRFLFTLLTEQ